MIKFRHILSPAHSAMSLFRRFKSPKTEFARIGKHQLRLSANSNWPAYRRAFHLYDTALTQIASVLHDKYPMLKAIDIGANIGDTAALIRDAGQIPVLCIEGDTILLPVLTENVAKLGSEIVIEPSFVGPEDKVISLNSTDDLGRNACLVDALDPSGSVSLRSLGAILADHPEFCTSKLLKTDTEGFDFDIIRQSMDFIRQSKPAIFFEYDPHLRPDEVHGGLDTIHMLIDAGYSTFIYYDNFGNYLLNCNSCNSEVFSDLDCYLASNRRHGIAVYYFDICALHGEDADLLPRIKSCTQR